MQAPGGKDEDTENGFKYGGWQVPFFGDDDDTIPVTLNNAGALLIGRKTYDIFAGYWPTTGKDIEFFGDIMNKIPKYVASKTLQKTDWENSTLLKGDVAEAVAKLKIEPGKDIYMFGSGNLCQTLMIHPLVLGQGKRLFQAEGPKQDLELIKSKTTQSGILVLTYKVKT